tara:strand:- start:4726 stop:5226 length:501 start_codon:yes stop_codon:yes gene_type:complete
VSYIQITRNELEDWLDSLPFDWERVVDKEGIYLIKCSDRVAIKLSSTQTQYNEAMGKGHASMNLSLVSKINGWSLNKKARDRKHFKRTSGWRKTWANGVSHWVSEYNSKASFYEKIADREAYKSKWLSIIRASPNNTAPALRRYQDKLMEGGILWESEEAKVMALV